MTETPDEPEGWTPTDQLILDRIYEHVVTSIAAEPDEERRAVLQEFVEDGDFGIQYSRPGFVLVTVGDLDVGELSLYALRRPDEPELN